ncbi:ankyrin repeat domain-containing protein [Candidatus Babela massiliensis]|uniref:Ankyrin repeats containing protein n=1 Tax=Candidatus Babela massiliensis TaxID=673862 RepID=V6DJ26_9BACT|nr:ankyrin repeat domain-containing protein [Candidatus Babela massiliensis]CDK30928.1 Ankyrin repeats containing protein [Candidatus Babela massiliensis]
MFKSINYINFILLSCIFFNNIIAMETEVSNIQNISELPPEIKLEVIKNILEKEIKDTVKDNNFIWYNLIKNVYQQAAKLRLIDKDFNALVQAELYKIFFGLLKSHNIDINNLDKNGDTALIAAVQLGREDLVKLLIRLGLSVNRKNKRNETALMYAAGKGLENIVRLLLEHRTSIDDKDDYGTTALMKASFNGHIDIVKLLIENKANVNARGDHGRTTLMDASEQGHYEIVKLLIDQGANVNAHDVWFNTALMEASFHGETNIVKLLIDQGANVNAKDDQGRTALMKAIDQEEFDENIENTVKLLLDYGADVDIRDNNHHESALDIAERLNHKAIVKLIKEHKTKQINK